MSFLLKKDKKKIALCFIINLIFPGEALCANLNKDNIYIERLFYDDQNDRKDPSNTNLVKLYNIDKERRRKLSEIIKSGGLVTAEDYYRSAYIFQHGDDISDFLMAHCLAITSLAKGNTDPDTAWIAAATLDRFLQRSGKPQIYGTQTTITHGGPPSLDPYDKEFLNDSLREGLHVPTLKQQEENLHNIAEIFSKKKN